MELLGFHSTLKSGDLRGSTFRTGPGGYLCTETEMVARGQWRRIHRRGLSSIRDAGLLEAVCAPWTRSGGATPVTTPSKVEREGTGHLHA